MQEPFKFCSACGQQNNLGAQFCQKCGAKYSGAPPLIAQPQPHRRPESLRFLLFLVVAFFGCIVFGWIFKSIQSDQPTPSASAALSSSPTPRPSPTPDLPSSELLARAKTLLARPYDKAAYDGAMDLLNRVPLKVKEFGESDRLKQKIIRAREREDAAAGAAARKVGAENVERGMLSKGYDVTVTVSGPENHTIKITYVLMNRPLVYQLVEGGFLNQLRSQGFRKVIFSDGYDSTWWYNL